MFMHLKDNIFATKSMRMKNSIKLAVTYPHGLQHNR